MAPKFIVEGSVMVPKNIVITFVLSALPGLGHMYLGLNKRGLQFMAAFFGCIFMITQMPLLFSFVLPIIWFYSLFDALQLNTTINERLRRDPDAAWPSGTPGVDELINARDVGLDPIWIGAGSLVIGVSLLLNKLFPRIWQFLSRDLGTIVLAVALIGYGSFLIYKHFVKQEKS